MKLSVYVGNIEKVKNNNLEVKHVSVMPGMGFAICSHSVQTESYKDNATLIKVNSGYVDVDNINSIIDVLRIKRYITKDGFHLDGPIMSGAVPPFARPGSLVVQNIEPSSEFEGEFDTSIWQLKKMINKKRKQSKN